MGLFDNISSAFSKNESNSGFDDLFKKDSEALFNYLKKKVAGSSASDAASATIKNFINASTKDKKKTLTQSYLFVEKYLTDINKSFKQTKEQLRELIKVQYPKLLEVEDFALIFEKEEKQEFLLFRRFLNDILEHTVSLFGESGSKTVQKIKVVLKQSPDKYYDEFSFTTGLVEPKNLQEWANYLKKLTLHTFDVLTKKIGEEATIRCFDKAYNSMASSYISLDSFQVIIAVLPDQLLDESRLGALTRHQIERLLLKRADYFEQITNQLSQKNKELENAQKLLIEAKEKAELATKAKAMFLANMSHEIRTPMNAVIGMTDILRETELTKEQLNYVDTIAKSGSDLITIINDILDYSKIESGKLEISEQTVDLYKQIEEVLYMLALKAHEKSLEILYRIEDDVPSFIKSDPVRLKQVLVNLITNAIKFTNQGYVRVHVSCKKHDTQKGQIVFKIEDTGIGIEQEKLEDIFNSFTQVDLSSTKQFEGTGLGLTISKTIVEMMKGEIEVESTADKGSTFSFYIETEFENNLEPPKPDYKGLKAHLASHSAIFTEDIEKQLRSWNIEPATFHDSIGLEKYLDSQSGVGIFFLDYNFVQYCDDSLLEKLSAVQKKNSQCVLLYPLGANVERKFLDVFERRFTKPLKRSDLISELDNYKGISSQLAVSEEQEPAKSTDQPISILVVEDNITNQVVVRAMLNKLGYTASVANNGVEALEIMNTQKFDLIFMDVQMPVLDGLETTKEIRSQNEFFREPVIIALTANAMQEDRDTCLNAGMDDFMTKPIKIEKIASFLEKWFPDK